MSPFVTTDEVNPMIYDHQDMERALRESEQEAVKMEKVQAHKMKNKTKENVWPNSQRNQSQLRKQELLRDIENVLINTKNGGRIIVSKYNIRMHCESPI